MWFENVGSVWAHSPKIEILCRGCCWWKSPKIRRVSPKSAQNRTAKHIPAKHVSPGTCQLEPAEERFATPRAQRNRPMIWRERGLGVGGPPISSKKWFLPLAVWVEDRLWICTRRGSRFGKVGPLGWRVR